MQRNICMVCADGRFRMKHNIIIINNYIPRYYIVVSWLATVQQPAQRPLTGWASSSRLGAGEPVESEADS